MILYSAGIKFRVLKHTSGIRFNKFELKRAYLDFLKDLDAS
jgi:hypothetical protein